MIDNTQEHIRTAGKLDEWQYKLWALYDGAGWTPTDDTCSVCAGLGVITADVSVEHPVFGRAFICICRRQEALIRLAERQNLKVGLPEKRKECTFTWFDAQSEKLRKGKTDARKLAGMMAAGDPLLHNGVTLHSLILHGIFGMGKSGMMAAIGQELIQRGEIVLWIDAGEFIDDIYKAQERMFQRDAKIASEDSRAAAEFGNLFDFVDSVAEAPILLLDDLGDVEKKKPITDFQRDKFYSVIRRRYEKNLRTVITTNLKPDGVYQQFGGRIAERLGESWHWIEMTGDSIRFPGGK